MHKSYSVYKIRKSNIFRYFLFMFNWVMIYQTCILDLIWLYVVLSFVYLNMYGRTFYSFSLPPLASSGFLIDQGNIGLRWPVTAALPTPLITLTQPVLNKMDHILQTASWNEFCYKKGFIFWFKFLWWGLNDNKSSLVQVIAWDHQATSQYFY